MSHNVLLSVISMWIEVRNCRMCAADVQVCIATCMRVHVNRTMQHLSTTLKVFTVTTTLRPPIHPLKKKKPLNLHCHHHTTSVYQASHAVQTAHNTHAQPSCAASSKAEAISCVSARWEACLRMASHRTISETITPSAVSSVAVACHLRACGNINKTRFLMHSRKKGHVTLVHG